MADYAPYLAWAEDTLGVRTEGVAVSSLPAPYGRGLVATTHIRRGSTLVSVPLAATLSTLTLKEHAVFPLVKQLMDARVSLVEDDVLALMLVHEKLRGADSRFSQHIAALPETLNSPFFWTDDEVEAFAATNVYATAKAMRAQVRFDFDAMSAAWATAAAAAPPGAPAPAIAPAAFTFELYRWAIGTVWSRFVSLRINRRYHKAMLPVFDMANHSRHAATRHSFDAKTNCVVLTSDQAWEPGQQVCLPYGDVSLLKSIQLYGAAFNEPEAERYRLQMSMAPHATGYREKAKLMLRFAGAVDYDNADAARWVGGAGPGAAAGAGRAGVPPELQGRIAATEGGTTCEFELRANVPNLALLRTLRIQLAVPESLPELERVMSRDPDRGIDPAHELRIATFLHSALTGELRKSVDAGARGAGGGLAADAARVAALKAVWAAGDAAMAELAAARGRAAGTTPLAAAGSGGGGGGANTAARAPAAPAAPAAADAPWGAAADDDDDAGGAPSILAGAAGGSGGGGRRGKAGKGGKRRAPQPAPAPRAATPPAPAALATSDVEGPPTPAAAAAEPAAAAVAVDAGAGAEASGAALLSSDHEYRLALAAHLRAVEQRVLGRQAGLLAEDIATLTAMLRGMYDAEAAEEAAAAATAAAAAGRGDVLQEA